VIFLFFSCSIYIIIIYTKTQNRHLAVHLRLYYIHTYLRRLTLSDYFHTSRDKFNLKLVGRATTKRRRVSILVYWNNGSRIVSVRVRVTSMFVLCYIVIIIKYRSDWSEPNRLYCFCLNKIQPFKKQYIRNTYIFFF